MFLLEPTLAWHCRKKVPMDTPCTSGLYSNRQKLAIPQSSMPREEEVGWSDEVGVGGHPPKLRVPTRFPPMY